MAEWKLLSGKNKNKQGESAMERATDQADAPSVSDHTSRGEVAKLIRKLRWIGMEDEARRLQRIASTLPPEEAGSVCVDPYATD